MVDKPIPSFRSPITNRRFTSQLFYEQWIDLPVELRSGKPIFSLHHDKEGLINFRRVYVDLGDPTGWAVSQQLLENYDHWLLLMKSPWFIEAKEVWDVELDAKLAYEGLAVIRSYAEGIEGVSPAVTVSAAKYLADKAYRKAVSASIPAKRGRPSKEEVAGALASATASAAEVADDLKRIRLVKGN